MQCSVLQYVAVCCSVFNCAKNWCHTRSRAHTHASLLGTPHKRLINLSTNTSESVKRDLHISKHTATFGATLQHALRITLHHTAAHCNTLQHTIIHCNIRRHAVTRSPHHTAPHCTTLQHTATHRNIRCHTATRSLHHTATHCNTLHHTATH